MAKSIKRQLESSGARGKRLKARQPPTKQAAGSLWEQIVEIGHRIPDSELRKLPKDLSKRLDHYLYGSWLKR